MNDTFEFTPQEHLVHNRTYECSLLPEVRDLAGNILGRYHNWSFRTEQAPFTNSAPRITGYVPYATIVYAKSLERIDFSVEVVEDDMDALNIRWYVNGVIIMNECGEELQFTAPSAPNGTVIHRTISVEVSDGEFNIGHNWILIVSESGNGPGEGKDENERTVDGTFFGSSMGRGMAVIMGLVLIAIMLFYLSYHRKKV